MQLSPHLSLAEMVRSSTAKRRGIRNLPTPEALVNMKILAEKIFEPVRQHFGVPIYVTSGYRCKALNDAIGGSPTSQHMQGEAMDIDMDGTTNGVTNAMIFNYIRHNLDFDQLIWEFGTASNPDWVHVSYESRGTQRKQVLLAKKVNGRTKYTLYK